MIKGELPRSTDSLSPREPIRPRHDLDPVSRQLIAMLQADGRRPYASMASELEIPERLVRRRVEQLLETGVIAITAVSDAARLGFAGQAMLGIHCESGAARALAETLAAMDEYVYIVLTAGSFDVMAELCVRDRARVLELIADLEQLPVVTRVQTYHYGGLEKMTHTWDVR